MGGLFRELSFFNRVSGAWLSFFAVLAWAGTAGSASPDKTRAELESQFVHTIRPFLQTHCVSCHGKEKPQAQLDLSSYANFALAAKDYPHLSLVLDKLASGQMPPPSLPKQPSPQARKAVISWIQAVRLEESRRNAGDPGPVLARRLSNAEYDYTLRDLTGVDLRPTREFPVDPANQEGFDNSGESLTLSPALMKKYVSAAREISDHLVLTSTGLEFASHPVLADTDRDKFCILRIVDFYQKQRTDLADYFQASWKFRYRRFFGQPNATLQTAAVQSGVSPRYLEQVWNTLNAPGVTVGPLAKLQSLWNSLPPPQAAAPHAVEGGCTLMRDWAKTMRKKVAWKFPNLRVPRGFSAGGQCFVLWKDRQYAAHRRGFDASKLQIGGVPAAQTLHVRKKGERPASDQTVTDPVDPDLFVPKEEAARAPYLASFTQFCRVFPDAFYVSERGRMFVDDPNDQGRLLTAGLHNSLGYFRDDTPLMELILDDKARQQLDHLWMDFDQVAFVPERMHREFFHYERAESGTITGSEFDFVRAEDADATSDAKIKLLAEVYTAKARKSLEANGGDPTAITAIEDHFRWVSAHLRETERERLASEPAHRKALLDFAERAYRRPLIEAERTGILAFYTALRQKDHLSHEDAIRDGVVSILMSPKFLFRFDLGSAKASALSSLTRLANDRPAAASRKKGVEPLSDYALASRLSYFLWSSLPDRELLSHAAAGNLHKPEVLVSQAHRMLQNPKVRALALEFGGNWLDFRRFEEHNAVDRDRFPAFNDALREAMFEEPVRFLMDQFQHNGSVLDLLYGKYTFVNTDLARHYGMKEVKVEGKNWVRVENADRYGRGGLLPMAVFLTKNSPGLRTSPVKRGYWMVRRVLGETIPPPPPTVPQLPSDESKLGSLTLRQALAQHRENPACAGCHARFDAYGLVFEGYGPVGEIRKTDLGGKPVDAKAPFPGGTERSGLAGLLQFVREKRQGDFVATFSRKLLSYALGRSLQPSDDLLLLQMQGRLASKGCRFETLIETLVTSPQFRSRRAPSVTSRKET